MARARGEHLKEPGEEYGKEHSDRFSKCQRKNCLILSGTVHFMRSNLGFSIVLLYLACF